MTGILDHIPQGSILDGIGDDWPRSCSRVEWFEMTRTIVQDTIAGMNLDPASEAEVIEHFTAAGLL